jgi:uncharacterized protein YecT (DUF1311 family)
VVKNPTIRKHQFNANSSPNEIGLGKHFHAEGCQDFVLEAREGIDPRPRLVLIEQLAASIVNVRVRACLWALLRASVLAGSWFAFPHAAFAANDPLFQYDDPIGKTLSACVGSPKNQTTIGLAQCYSDAYASYERLLNKVYPLVLQHLDPASRALVKQSQVRWLAWQKAELEAQRGSWTQQRGTIFEIEIPQARALAVRSRILELYLFWPGYATESNSFIHPWQ